MHLTKIPVLCVMENSNYFKISDNLDLFTKERNAYTFNDNRQLIAHPPCQQWSKLRSFAKENKAEKELAFHCLKYVNQNGGILEHPAGSQLWKIPNAFRDGTIISINQHWFGFPAQKRTWLYFVGIKPIATPLNFDTPLKTVSSMHSAHRSKQPLLFCEWLVNCLRQDKA